MHNKCNMSKTNSNSTFTISVCYLWKWAPSPIKFGKPETCGIFSLSYIYFLLGYIHYVGGITVTILIRLFCTLFTLPPSSLPLNHIPAALKVIPRGFLVLFHIGIWNIPIPSSFPLVTPLHFLFFCPYSWTIRKIAFFRQILTIPPFYM
jgi:hypothetical protein